MKLVPWTVNDKEKMKSLIADGVDGIITDYPNLFAEIGK
jgi:glycerophosphoryl diester phosphodiesterase